MSRSPLPKMTGNKKGVRLLRRMLKVYLRVPGVVMSFTGPGVGLRLIFGLQHGVEISQEKITRGASGVDRYEITALGPTYRQRAKSKCWQVVPSTDSHSLDGTLGDRFPPLPRGPAIQIGKPHPGAKSTWVIPVYDLGGSVQTFRYVVNAKTLLVSEIVFPGLGDLRVRTLTSRPGLPRPVPRCATS